MKSFMRLSKRYIAVGSAVLGGILAASSVWYQQYIYWVNTGHVEYKLVFSMANHFGAALVICAFWWLMLTIFGRGRDALMRSLGIVSLSSTVVVMLELLVRCTGVVQNYGETRDGRYIPQYDDTPQSAYYTYPENSKVVMESGKEFRFERKTNELGLLFKAELKKPEGINRIIALGDSFTAGDGAHEDSTWVSFMERKLILEKKEATYLQVLNAGVQGSDPVYQYRLLKEKLLCYNPNLVIIAINNTDIGEVGSRGGFERYVSDTLCVTKLGPWWEPAYASSHIIRLLLRVVFGVNYSLMTQVDFERNQERCALELQNVIKKFEILANQHGFQLLVCFIPLQGDLREGNFHSLFDLEQRMSPLDEVNVEYLNLFPAYLEGGMSAQSVETYYWPLDGHHKAEGYRVLGEAVAKHIIEKELLYLE